jgi:hypothetical protein
LTGVCLRRTVDAVRIAAEGRTGFILGVFLVAWEGGCTSEHRQTNSAMEGGTDQSEDASVDSSPNDAKPPCPDHIPEAALAANSANAALPPDARAKEALCDAGPTGTGIGLACTRGGRQCSRGLLCTADFSGQSGICTILGCGCGAADCGPDASCCTLLQAGGASLCFPNACLPGSCLEGY